MSRSIADGPTTESAGIFSLVNEPWYVIVGIIAFTVVVMWAEGRLKKRGWWPYKGDNMFVDQFIWGAVLLLIVVPVALIVRWLS